MKPERPTPVKLFVGGLYNKSEFIEQARKLLKQEFGEIDYTSPEYPFEITDYYETELGTPIFRRFFSFEKLLDPGYLANVKVHTNKIEDSLSHSTRRTVNLDPGYLDFNKMVLASAKYNAQKIYLACGIYADPTLWYEKGTFTAYPFAFPDFKTEVYDSAFLHIRALYKKQLREA